MSLTSDKKRWDDLHAALAKANDALNELDSALRSKYGSRYENSWLPKGQRDKKERLQAKVDAVRDKIIELLVKVSPRGERWLQGVPSHWLTDQLTWEDAIRPANEPLSVVVPGAWGHPDGYVQEASGRALSLWKFNRITGLWNHVRTVTPETRDEWLRVFQRDEPGETFVVSKNKPTKAPTAQEEVHMARKTMRTNEDPAPDAEAAGAEYAQEQLQSDYFQDWIRDQLLEASRMDPDKVLPLETKQDAMEIAKNMLQQLQWDTSRDLDGREIANLIGVDSTSQEDVKEFFKGFRETLHTNRAWLADELLEIKSEMSGRSVGEARRSGTLPDANPLSGPRKDARDKAIQQAVDKARETGEAYAVWMDRKGEYHVSPSFSARWEDIIAVAHAPHGHLSYKRYGTSENGPRVRAPRGGSGPDPASGWGVTQRMMQVYAQHKGLGDYRHNSAVPMMDGKGTWTFYAQRPGERAQKYTTTQNELESVYKRRGMNERHVRDYIAIDSHDRPVGPRHKGYSDAKRDADNAGGTVKFVPSGKRAPVSEMRRPKAGRSVTRRRR